MGAVIVARKENDEPLREALHLWADQAPHKIVEDAKARERIALWDCRDLETLMSYEGKIRCVRGSLTRLDRPEEAPEHLVHARHRQGDPPRAREGPRRRPRPLAHREHRLSPVDHPLEARPRLPPPPRRPALALLALPRRLQPPDPLPVPPAPFLRARLWQERHPHHQPPHRPDARRTRLLRKASPGTPAERRRTRARRAARPPRPPTSPRRAPDKETGPPSQSTPRTARPNCSPRLPSQNPPSPKTSRRRPAPRSCGAPAPRHGACYSRARLLPFPCISWPLLWRSERAAHGGRLFHL